MRKGGLCSCGSNTVLFEVLYSKSEKKPAASTRHSASAAVFVPISPVPWKIGTNTNMTGM